MIAGGILGSARRRPPTRAPLICVLLVSLCLLIAFPGHAAEGAPKEYEVKAALVFKFTLFVDWPAEKLPVSRAPFLIGVLGEDPFKSVLDETVKGKKTQGRKVKVVRSSEPEALTHCQVVFISASEEPRLQGVLALFGDSHVLTIGDMENFAERGGIINLTKKEDMVGFEINNTAATQAGLKISSQLLKIAKIVDSSEDEEG